MPNPANVHARKSFGTRKEGQLYADGLQAGINFESQGHGSEPSEVRIETDILGITTVYVERGHYTSTNGEISWS